MKTTAARVVEAEHHEGRDRFPVFVRQKNQHVRLSGSLAVFESDGDIELGRLAAHERFVLLDDVVRLHDGIGRHGHGAINEVGEQREDLRSSDVPPLLGSRDRFALGGDERVGQVVVGHARLVVVDVVVELLEFTGEQHTGGKAKGGYSENGFSQHQSNELEVGANPNRVNSTWPSAEFALTSQRDLG